MPYVRATIFFLAMIACIGTPSRAQEDGEPKPLPSGPDAFTKAKFEAEGAAFWITALRAECGKVSPIPADLEPLVDELMAAGAVMAWGATHGAKSADIRPAITALRKANLDDPVVQFLVGSLMQATGTLDGAASLADAALAKLDERQSSPQFRCVVHQLHAVVCILTKQDRALQRELAVLEDLWCAAIASDVFAMGNAPRFLLQPIRGLRSGRSGADQAKFLDRLAKAAGKPHYTALVLRGEHHVALAWKARGAVAAAAIGASDRSVFADELQSALAVAEQAAQLRPDLPEAPTLMLKVLGPGGGDAGDERAWFDRAVAAQFDWEEAYMTYLHYLQPRWGGSPKELIAFGEECAATKRYDTDVPWRLRTAIRYLCLDVADTAAVWGNATVQRLLAEVDDGKLAAATTDPERDLARSSRIMSLALGGKAVAAAELYEKGGKRFAKPVLADFGVTEEWLQKTLRPHLSDYTPAGVASRDLFAGHADAGPRSAARPLADHAKAISSHDAMSARGRWIAEVFRVAYASKGKRDPAWDAEVDQLFDHYGEHLMLAESTDADLTASMDTARVERILAAGCKDPLVQYVAARALAKTSPKESDRMYTNAMNGVRREHSLLLRMWVTMSFEQTGRGRFMPEIRRQMVGVATDPNFAERRGRMYVAQVWGRDRFALGGAQWFNVDATKALSEQKGTHPWLVDIVNGLFLLQRGKHGKLDGADRAQTLRDAAARLKAAHALYPDCPEAAAAMVQVTTLDPSVDAASPREWLDRALDGEIDYPPALNAYVDSLLPDAGGSLAAMFHFAVECLETKRFDTQLPLWFVSTLAAAQHAGRGGREVWAATGVDERLDAMFRGYLAAEKAPFGKRYWISGRCLTAWAGGRYEAAAADFAELGGAIEPAWFRLLGIKDPDVVRVDLEVVAKQKRRLPTQK
jgi:hypothetical protein